jgi:putative two-component system response regulator
MKQKILIADDSATVRIVLEKALESWGYDVISCKDGSTALNILLSDNSPRIAILDWIMPGLSGIDVCRQIKGCGKFIYSILLTSKTDREDLELAIDSGAYNFLSKPVPLGVLRRFIEVGERLISDENKLKENERNIRIKCYKAIADLAETRDNETGLHLSRISRYSSLIAEKIGGDRNYIEEISIFSQLHDIGKVGIPDGILLAQRSISKTEFELIKTHTILGDKILRPVPTMKMAADIARFHHEKWDGTGYPDGLKGEDIPVEARIVGLVDVFDALRSHRPYKAAWSYERARNHLLEQRGIHFDPNLIDIFTQLEDEIASISEQYLELY